MLPMVSYAEETEIGGIYYQLNNDSTAEVISNPEGYKYKGDIIIPSFVSYNAKEYKVISIKEYAFCWNDQLNTITMPNTISFIGRDAFIGCSGLTAVYISDLKAWCNIKFEGSVEGDTNPLYYAHHLILNGEEVIDLIIPQGLEIIKAWTFAGCTAIKSVTIPKSVVEINSLAFCYCRKLERVNIEDLTAWCNIEFGNSHLGDSTPLEIAGHLYLNNEEIINLEIPNKVKEIKQLAFCGCTGLKSVTIPSSVTKIRYHAFKNCTNLHNVILGQNISLISVEVFFNCQRLSDVYCCAEKIRETDSQAFNLSPIESATLHVPTSSLEFYKNENPWKKFGTIVSWNGEDTKFTQIHENSIVIKTSGRQLTLEGVNDGETIDVFTINGQKICSAISHNSLANITTNLQPGTAVIVKINNKCFKVVIE